MARDNNNHIPEFASMVQMARLLNLSRSRFYQLMKRGISLKPVYLLGNKRPVFTGEMILANLQVKMKNIGVNGTVCMFNGPRTIATAKTMGMQGAAKKGVDEFAEVREALASLGLEGLSEAQIKSAVEICFPAGTTDVDNDEIITGVFRHIRAQHPEHKHRT